MSQQQGQIIYGKVLTQEGILEDGAVAIQDDLITFVGRAEHLPPRWTEHASYIRARQSYVVPGFIDTHIHGGIGYDFMDANKEVLDSITRFHASHGTTAMLATTMTAPMDNINTVLHAIQSYCSEKMPYSQIEGVHLEGPFINPDCCGAQNRQHIIPPDVAWLEHLDKHYPGLIKQVTLAPECEGALEVIVWLQSHGITSSVGHTRATYEEMQPAIQLGLRHAIHMFNAMSPLHHRKPGVVGAVLNDDRISTEIIADGLHVHPACIQLLAKLKLRDKLLLITDATPAAGLGDGDYSLGDLTIEVHDGKATLKGHPDQLAGSTLTMDQGFRFLVQEVGLSIEEASRMASCNPAKLLGIGNRTGSLEAGKQADILLLDDDLMVQSVWVKGTQIK